MSKVSCPAEGCDYSGLKESVLGHYSGKTDGQHPGGYQKAKSLLAGGGKQGSTPEPEPEPAGTEDSAEPESSRSSGENPVFGDAEPVSEPEPAEQGQPSQQQSSPSSGLSEAGDEPVCLRCGGELYDFRRFETGKYHNVNGHQVWVRGDYQCASCGMWLEEDNE